MVNSATRYELAETPIPRQKWSSGLELFIFSRFQGIWITRILHAVAQILNLVVTVLFVLGSFTKGVKVAILGLIFGPLLGLLHAFMIRVAMELIVSVLLIPSLMAERGEPMSENHDIDAYTRSSDDETHLSTAV